MSKSGVRCLRLAVVVGGFLWTPGIWAGHVDPHALNNRKPKSAKVNESQHTRRRMRHLARGRTTAAHRASVRRASATPAGASNLRAAGPQGTSLRGTNLRGTNLRGTRP